MYLYVIWLVIEIKIIKGKDYISTFKASGHETIIKKKNNNIYLYINQLKKLIDQ